MGTPHPVDVYVGRRLRQKRTIAGLSQEAVGKEVGITFQQVQKYERGINRMGSSRLYDFAKVLKVQISYFFDGYGDYAVGEGKALGLAEAPATSFEHEKMDDRETLEVLRAYYRIKNPMLRKRVIELIKAMADDPAEARPRGKKASGA